jgi:hypothetical protein
MSTQLVAFTDDQIDVIYKATHLTETLNKKLATALPAGIYQGFNLVVNGTTDLVGIDPDAGATGHVAVIENDTDRSITVRNSGGSFTIDLSTLRDGAVTKKFAIAIWGQYSKGSNTGAAIRAYETYPTNELLTAPEAGILAILGEVEVASGGAPALIPAAAITQARRMSAWQNLAPGHGFWKPLLQNGNFEAASTVGNEQWGAYGWRLGDANSLLSASGVDAYIGGKSLNWTAVGLSSLIFTAEQYLGEPVTEGTDRIRVRGFYKILQIPVEGEIEVILDFANASGTPGSLDVRYLIPVDHISADWEEFGAVVDVPAGATRLHRFVLECNDTVMEVGAATHIARFDDWQVWKSWNGADSQQASRLGERVDASLRDLMFPLDTYTDRNTAPRMSRSGNTLLGEKAIDVAQGNFRARNSLGVGDDLVQSLAEAATARLVLPHRATNETVDGDVFTLLLESLPHTGTEASVRYYSDDIGNLFFTTNAKYTSEGVWTRDSDTDIATMVKIGAKDGLETLVSPADGTSVATFGTYFNVLGSHLISEAQPHTDFASLWEFEDNLMDGVAPYTGSTVNLGSTGWWEFAGGAGEGDWEFVYRQNTFLFIEDGTYRGWWRVINDYSGSPCRVQLARPNETTAFNFSVAETATVRFYQGIEVGQPINGYSGPVTRGMLISTQNADEENIVVRHTEAYGGSGVGSTYAFYRGDQRLYWVDHAGHVHAPRFSTGVTEVPIPITSWRSPLHTDWDLTDFGSGTQIFLEADGVGDQLVVEPFLRHLDIVTSCVVRVDPVSAAMTMNVYTKFGSSLGSATTSGTLEQTLSVTGLTETYYKSSPLRIVITAGAALDKVLESYVIIDR